MKGNPVWPFGLGENSDVHEDEHERPIRWIPAGLNENGDNPELREYLRQRRRNERPIVWPVGAKIPIKP